MALSAARALPALFFVLSLASPAFPASPAGPAGTPESPSGPVLDLNNALLKAMKNAGALGFEGRYKLLAPVLRRVFTFPVMARIATGGSWRKLTAGQRDRLTDAFARSSIATFASRFNGYSGERFEVTGERPALRGSVLVENRIVKASGEIVPINYLLRKFGGNWRIVDIFLKARYSELAIKRSEYRSIIKREGAEGLIEKLDEKAARLKSNSGK